MDSETFIEFFNKNNISFSLYPDHTTFVIPKQKDFEKEIETGIINERLCFCGIESKLLLELHLSYDIIAFLNICPK